MLAGGVFMKAEQRAERHKLMHALAELFAPVLNAWVTGAGTYLSLRSVSLRDLSRRSLSLRSLSLRNLSLRGTHAFASYV